jgi:hypothetical protein
LPDGSPDWIWREDAITALLASHQHGHLFVAGCQTNQGNLYPQFDHIALFSAPASTVSSTTSRRWGPLRPSVVYWAQVPAPARRGQATDKQPTKPDGS